MSKRTSFIIGVLVALSTAGTLYATVGHKMHQRMHHCYHDKQCHQQQSVK